jgi:Plasma-membrane choline transporter
MGSICFGSLLVGPVRFLRWFFVFFRPSSTESSSLMCLHECIHYVQSCVTFCIDSMAATCNSWAYTYIGIYHYGFLNAGNNATELFEKRGWSTIVSDDLVPNVLFLTSLVIGGVTGCFAYILSHLDRLTVVNPKDETGSAPFVEGVIIGLVLPSIVFSLISSSVNAVLVCFASSPMDFEVRHPQLSHDMRAAWREVWPRSLDVDDAVAVRLVAQTVPFIPAPPPYQGHTVMIRSRSPFQDNM